MNGQAMQEIPKLDLADFTQGDADQRSRFVQELGRAYEEIGFVAIRNHGIDNTILNDMYAQVAKFF